MSIQSGAAPLSATAQSEKSAYDQKLRAKYDAFLGNARSEILAALGALDEAKCLSPA